MGVFVCGSRRRFSLLFFFNSSPVIQTRGFIVQYGGEVKEGWRVLVCEGHGEINYRGRLLP